MDLTADFLRYAGEMAAKIKARRILVNGDIFPGRWTEIRELHRRVGERLLVFTADRDLEVHLQESRAEIIEVPQVNLTRLGQVKIALIIGLARGKIQQGDRLVCLTGVSGRMIDTLFTMEVGREFGMFTAGNLEIPAGIRPEVFEKVLETAVSLGSLGREGRPVGTTFVIGDTEKVLQHCQPLVLNPFQGHPPEERNVLDPFLADTIKEFATIDGAFVIRGDGLLEAAGVYLRPAAAGEKLPWGLGTRHYSSAGITATTAAVAITVSASTGTVTVFRQGRLVVEIERTSPAFSPQWMKRF